jgi:hypothetical protein
MPCRCIGPPCGANDASTSPARLALHFVCFRPSSRPGRAPAPVARGIRRCLGHLLPRPHREVVLRVGRQPVPLARTLQHTDNRTGWVRDPDRSSAATILRLVLEMGANGETERRSVEGELSLLELRMTRGRATGGERRKPPPSASPRQANPAGPRSGVACRRGENAGLSTREAGCESLSPSAGDGSGPRVELSCVPGPRSSVKPSRGVVRRTYGAVIPRRIASHPCTEDARWIP